MIETGKKKERKKKAFGILKCRPLIYFREDSVSWYGMI